MKIHIIFVLTTGIASANVQDCEQQFQNKVEQVKSTLEGLGVHSSSTEMQYVQCLDKAQLQNVCLINETRKNKSDVSEKIKQHEVAVNICISQFTNEEWIHFDDSWHNIDFIGNLYLLYLK